MAEAPYEGDILVGTQNRIVCIIVLLVPVRSMGESGRKYFIDMLHLSYIYSLTITSEV